MKSSSLSASSSYPRLRRLGIDVAITAVFNVVIAIIITYVMRMHGNFLVNLAIAMCIGTLAVTFIDGGRLLLWGFEKPPKLPFFLLLAVSLPAAQQLGNVIAAQITGLPAESLSVTRHRDPTSYIVVTLLVSLFITWFFWNRSAVAQLKAAAEEEKARAAAIERQAAQAQLQLLQAQIEPHMLFNTLANLQSLIAIDPPRAQHMLDQLIRYLRATLSSSRAQQTTLANEFSLMEAYLGLMSVRMGNRLSWSLVLPDALSQISVPPMLLQPLIENAIKHGLEPKIDGGHIRVEAARHAGMLVLSVADTGLGLDDAADHGMRVGLNNVRERLQVLYGNTASVSLTPNTPHGAIAQLRLPISS
jgi:signal transduction histidine kinase